MDSMTTAAVEQLEQYIPKSIRENLEHTYYEKINQRAQLANVIKDPAFLAHPLQHPALHPDHGAVHVRDVACRLLDILSEMNGVHFPKRSDARLQFMKGYGVLLAYVHDIGMAEVDYMENDTHAEFATIAMYNDYFEKILNTLWEENSGNVAWHITQFTDKKILAQTPRHIFREMLAMCCAHSKKCVATTVLNYPAELRHTVQTILSSANVPALKLYYANFAEESFQWLIATQPEARELADDVIDTIRVLRCANAARQRGARLRATGGHQIFLDQHTGNAMYAVNAHDQLFLIDSTDNLLGGEVNLSSTEFTLRGDLRISFYRGSFPDKTATDRAIFNAAIAINDVQEDMIGSFMRLPAGENNSSPDYLRKWQTVYILLENCDDNHQFSYLVQQQLMMINPALKDCIKLVPSLQNASELERNNYLDAMDLVWDQKTMKDFLEKVTKSGHKVTDINIAKAFAEVKKMTLDAGDTLIEVNTPASFVYVPLTDGLVGHPLGGYQTFPVHPFVPVGTTGVIRGDLRNSTIVAEKSVELLIIPRETYIEHWHSTYSEEEFIQLLASGKISIT